MSNPEIITRHLPNGGWAVSVRHNGKMIAFDFGPFDSELEARLAASEWLTTPEAGKLIAEMYRERYIRDVAERTIEQLCGDADA